MRLNTPILFIVFNRFELTKSVFEEIKFAKPAKLYIAADGHRSQVTNESKITNEIQQYLLNNINWDCQVFTKFNKENLGCRDAVSSAITWFFENEEMGIILEDDCLPSKSFFKFCEHSLLRYKNDLRIWHIAGNSLIPTKLNQKMSESYYFSSFNHIWGWATWANRWKFYDVNLLNIQNKDFLKKHFKYNRHQKYWSIVFDKIKAKKIDTWDYQWTFTCWYNDGLSVVPMKNLITNIGFGIDATHTQNANSNLDNLKKYEIEKINDPIEIKRNNKFDKYILNNIFIPPIYTKIFNKLKRLFNK